MSEELPGASPKQPVRIDHYEVIKHIATGGMGAVYKARDVNLGREVAIKVLAPELANKPGMADRFKEEAKHAAKLRHENIVSIYGFNQTADGMYYLAMEFVDGIDLHAYINRKKRLEPEEARYYIIHAAKALDQMHRLGLVHRDIKPSNFLLTTTSGKPIVKLTDLGLAREVDDDQFRLTRTGTTVGTVDYMAPEQARDSRSADIRSDIYSLGCTYFHMLAGQPPFPEGGLTERLYKHIEVPPPDIRNFNAKIPDAAVAVLRRMMEKKQVDRYQTPAELLKDLVSPKKAAVDLTNRTVLEGLAELEDKPKHGPGDSAASTSSSRTAAIPVKTKMRRDDPRLKRKVKTVERDESRPWIIIEGWKAWTGVIGSVAAIAVLMYLMSGTSTTTRQPRGRTVAQSTYNPMEDPGADPGAVQPIPPENEPPPIPELPPPEPKSQGKDRGKDKDKDKDKDKVNDKSKDKALDKGKAVENKGAPANPTADIKPIDDRPRQAPISEPGAPPVYQPPQVVQAQLQKEIEQSRTQPSRDFDSFNEMIQTFREEMMSVSDPRHANIVDLMQKLESQQNAPPQARDQTLTTLRREVLAQQKKTPDPKLQALIEAIQEVYGAPRGQDAGKAATRTGTGPLGANSTAKGSPPPTEDIPDESPIGFESRATAPHLIVTRSHAGGDGLHVPTLAAALAKARPDGETIIEIQENGPLFETPLAVKGRSLILRGGKGFRPVIVWDSTHPSYGKGERFLSVTEANLTLENLDFLLKRPEAASAELGGLVRVTQGSLFANHCTVSVAGADARAAAVFQLDGAPLKEKPAQCQLHRCFVRGTDLVVVDVRTPGVEVRCEGCLLVNTSRPLIQATAAPAPTTSVRILRSTLAAGQNLLQVRPQNPKESKLSFKWLGWDSLLAHSGSGLGDLISLTDGASPEGINWRAVNCICAGWPNLLATQVTSISDVAVWRKVMHHEEGDLIVPDPWPSVAFTDASEAPAIAFRTQGSALHYSASNGQGSLGCNVALLPRGRDNWQNWAFDPPPLPALAQPQALNAAPEITPLVGDFYSGEQLDLNVKDLGQHLDQVQQKYKLAPKVILHLVGSGEKKTSPILLKAGVSLHLYFEPPMEGASPLVLIPKDSTASQKPALIEVEDGSLEMTNGAIRLPNYQSAPCPKFILKVAGDLLLRNCHLQGPLGRMPDSYLGLIQFTPAAASEPSQPHCCSFNDCLLVSGRGGLEILHGGGGCRMQNCILVTGTDGIAMKLDGMTKARLQTYLDLENNTFACRRADIVLGDAPKLRGAPLEPVSLRIKSNIFLDPFAGERRQVSVFNLEGNALARGLFGLRAEDNVFDKKLNYVHSGTTWPLPDPKTSAGRVAGPGSERAPVIVDWPNRKVDLNQFEPRDKTLDRNLLAPLALPASFKTKGTDALPGADFAQLGIATKSGKGPK